MDEAMLERLKKEYEKAKRFYKEKGHADPSWPPSDHPWYDGPEKSIRYTTKEVRLRSRAPPIILHGRYYINSECLPVGRGGGATVFAASDKQDPDGRYCIKFYDLRSARASKRATDRHLDRERYTRREAVALEAINNMVPRHVERDELGNSFLVMKRYAPNEEHETDMWLMDDSRSLRERTIGLGLDIAACLIDLHRKKILHLDLKPANIVFDGDKALVTDLGTHVTDETPLEGWHSIGNKDYRAPELFRDPKASSEKPTPACDIYSLGAILIHTLRGSDPLGDILDKTIADIKLPNEDDIRTRIENNFAPPWYDAVRGDMRIDTGDLPAGVTIEEGLKRGSTTALRIASYHSLSMIPKNPGNNDLERLISYCMTGDVRVRVPDARTVQKWLLECQRRTDTGRFRMLMPSPVGLHRCFSNPYDLILRFHKLTEGRGVNVRMLTSPEFTRNLTDAYLLALEDNNRIPKLSDFQMTLGDTLEDALRKAILDAATYHMHTGVTTLNSEFFIYARSGPAVIDAAHHKNIFGGSILQTGRRSVIYESVAPSERRFIASWIVRYAMMVEPGLFDRPEMCYGNRFRDKSIDAAVKKARKTRQSVQ